MIKYEYIVAFLNPSISLIYCMSLIILWIFRKNFNYILILSSSYAVRMLSFIVLFFSFYETSLILRQVSNLLIIASMMLLSIAMSHRYKQKPRYDILISIGVLTLSPHFFFLFIKPNLPMRALFINYGMAVICLLIIFDILKRINRTPSENLLIILVIIAIIIYTIRPLIFQIPGIDAEEIESSYWMIISISDALICATLGIGIFAIIAVDVMDGFKAEAQTDALTGLLNRRGFDARARDVLAEQTTNPQSAVIMADLDHFKTINDRFGHDGGDRILQLFAKILRENSTDDTVIGRQGGEEFAVLLPSGQAKSALIFANQVRCMFKKEAVDVFSEEINPTVSLGIAIANESESLSALMSRADRALYQAKNSGRDCIKEC